jgi:hypothetical protein
MLRCCTVLGAFALMPVRSQTQTTPIPRLEKRGAVTQLIVDGKPFLVLAGELGNNTSSTLENMKPIWPALVKINLNTVLAAVAWAWIEPEEGKFDFALVDGLIQDARRHNLRLILLWFGSWKNGTSSYCPAWVKQDFERFPLVQDQDGKGREILSTLSDANVNADARAFAALMRRIRQVDSQARTVVMIQVQNEVGVLGDSRDRCPAANEAFAKPVPQALMNYLEKHKDALLPELRKVWEAGGFKTSGTWEEMFGKGTTGNETFMAWHYARYVNRVAEAGKKEYPLPMFVNAWLVQPQDKQPGDYPSGGPVDHVHEVWRAGAPQIDILAPDIYLTDFDDLCARYSRSGNPMFIPETRADAANAFRAVGRHNAIGFSPFGIERQTDPESLFAQSYAALSQLAPLILANQGKGTMDAVVAGAGDPAQKVSLGGYRFSVSMGRGRWGVPPPAPPLAAGAPQPPTRGFAVFISAGPDEYWVAGSGIVASVEPITPGPPLASLASVEEGTFAGGRWIVGRRLAGDDTGQGGEARASLRLPASRVGILHVKLYRYR